MTKTALITGITGQDGSYLAELLLGKGYQVHGIIRRSSSFNTGRIDHIYADPHDLGARLHLHYGDLSDASGLESIIATTQPQEIYHLGAQSHVRVSFDTPEYTGDVTGLGTIRILEAARRTAVKSKVYQASSSELYGKVVETPQSETTPFHPRSPYAAAKAYAFYVAQNYREAYGMFVCNGILFNHECLSESTPLIVKRDGMVDVVTPAELVPLRRKGRNVQTFELEGVECWDGRDWTPLQLITATKRRPLDSDHRVLCMQGRAGVVDVTAHHGMLDATSERRRADSLEEGDRLLLAEGFPQAPGWTALAPELAEFLGYMTAEGYVPKESGTMQFTSNDETLRQRVAELWSRLFLGATFTWYAVSGFDRTKKVGQLNLNGGSAIARWLRSQLYTADGFKRVPAVILNANADLQAKFLDAYYAGDGLKAGNGRSVKTNSQVLAQGLCWLYALQGFPTSVYVEQRGAAQYYQLNLLAGGDKGQHLKKDPAELRRIDEVVEPSEWVFDVETGSRLVCAGVGRLVVHNSERRGETFVTRKITRAVGRIKHGLQKEVFLGNLDAKRDWGHAKDYVEAMWLMLQQDAPDDYVVGTGETHSVREFLDLAFARAGLDPADHVRFDANYLRPAEVDVLLANPTKAKTKLGWTPRVSFTELVAGMVDHDLEQAAREKRAMG